MSNTHEHSEAADSELTDILSAAITLARGAGAILREGVSSIEAERGAGRGTQMTFKTSDIDPVTEYDVRSEKYIVGELQRLYPTHRIVGEEGGAYDAGAYDRQRRAKDSHDYEWQIDPIDGTVNF